MKILTDKYLEIYAKGTSNLDTLLATFRLSSKDMDFEYLTETSSIYSANIEWNSLDVNSFMNLKTNKKATKEVSEIKDLIQAYNFAQTNNLTQTNFLKTHKFSTKTILIASLSWKYRTEKVGVFWRQWLIYLAIEPEFVSEKMTDLFEDITLLLTKKLSTQEVFYYASFIHLVLAHIHPFADGNGRCARILEKWFLCEKLWTEFWKLPSEQYYKTHRNLYYENINLWVNYYEINYDKSLSFLLMFPSSLN